MNGHERSPISRYDPPTGLPKLKHRVLTIQETAELFGVSAKVVRKSIRDGDFAVIKVGRKTFVLRDPLEEKLTGK
jgi:excisionase family DNA binding protein